MNVIENEIEAAIDKELQAATERCIVVEQEIKVPKDVVDMMAEE